MQHTQRPTAALLILAATLALAFGCDDARYTRNASNAPSGPETGHNGDEAALPEITCIPSEEVCDGFDNDCDGLTDEDTAGAPLTTPCYTGPEGTEGVSACTGGIRVCQDGAFEASCRGQRIPQFDLCDDTLDQDCDGSPNVCGTPNPLTITAEGTPDAPIFDIETAPVDGARDVVVALSDDALLVFNSRARRPESYFERDVHRHVLPFALRSDDRHARALFRVSDLEHDGHPNIGLDAPDGRLVVFNLNNHIGELIPTTSVHHDGTGFTKSSRVGDLNHDGHPDLARLVDTENGMHIDVFLGPLNRTTAHTTPDTRVEVSGTTRAWYHDRSPLELGDLDGDGNLDLMVAATAPAQHSNDPDATIPPVVLGLIGPIDRSTYDLREGEDEAHPEADVVLRSAQKTAYDPIYSATPVFLPDLNGDGIAELGLEASATYATAPDGELERYWRTQIYMSPHSGERDSRAPDRIVRSAPSNGYTYHSTVCPGLAGERVGWFWTLDAVEGTVAAPLPPNAYVWTWDNASTSPHEVDAFHDATRIALATNTPAFTRRIATCADLDGDTYPDVASITWERDPDTQTHTPGRIQITFAAGVSEP